VKYFFYTILLVAALGTVAAIVNPPLVQQGAAIVGLELPQYSAKPVEENSSEDQLSKFLAQYPFVNNQNDAVVPATNVPMVVVPEPPRPPVPPFYATPASPFPAPTAEPVTPTYAHAWEGSHWDSAATAPIHVPPVVEDHPPAPIADWSGPAQPFQESVAAPQSVYAAAPREDTFPITQSIAITPQANVPGFTPTNYVPPHPVSSYQPPHPTPPISPPPGATLQASAVLIEDVPVHGTEMVARVGTHVILMGDILPKLRRAALRLVNERLKQLPEEERAQTPREEIERFINMFVEQHYSEILDEQILFTLVFSDYERHQDRASRNMLNDRMGEEFDRNEVPEMMKEFGAANIAALRTYLEEHLGSSLEKERRFWIREQIVRQWIGMSVQRATGECTYDEMTDFYQKNLAMFTSTPKARWQEMVVLLSRHNTEQEALRKISWMGNQVAQGAPFEEIAKANSDGFTASNGGIYDWTATGDLTSVELEQAIFSQPIGQLSPTIIRSSTGLHIIRVLERQEAKVVPFIEAQITIRERIRNLRTQRYQDEYLTELRRRNPTIIVKDRVDFNVNTPRTARVL
jgi:hypothetical protein